VLVIEGRRTLVVQRRPPLPSTLDGLRRSMRIAWETTITRRGARVACISDQDHRLFRFCEGRHVGTDGVIRDLRLLMCADCEAVCVRDVSVDRLPGLPTGRLLPRRRDLVLGWYSGSRPNERQYR
jgi:hypothetical protein